MVGIGDNRRHRIGADVGRRRRGVAAVRHGHSQPSGIRRDRYGQWRTRVGRRQTGKRHGRRRLPDGQRARSRTGMVGIGDNRRHRIGAGVGRRGRGVAAVGHRHRQPGRVRRDCHGQWCARVGWRQTGKRHGRRRLPDDQRARSRARMVGIGHNRCHRIGTDIGRRSCRVAAVGHGHGQPGGIRRDRHRQWRAGVGRGEAGERHRRRSRGDGQSRGTAGDPRAHTIGSRATELQAGHGHRGVGHAQGRRGDSAVGAAVGEIGEGARSRRRALPLQRGRRIAGGGDHKRRALPCHHRGGNRVGGKARRGRRRRDSDSDCCAKLPAIEGGGRDGNRRAPGFDGRRGEKQRVAADGGRHQRAVRRAGRMGDPRDDGDGGLDEICHSQNRSRQRQIGEVTVEGGAGIIGCHRGNCIRLGHRVADHIAKHGEPAVLIVEIGGIVGQVDEPLTGRAVRIAAQLGHRDGPPHVGEAGLVLHRGKRRDEIDRRTGGKIEAAVLNDEARDRTVHAVVGVVAGFDVSEKVGHRQGRLLVRQRHIDETAAQGSNLHRDPHRRAGHRRIMDVPAQVDRRGRATDCQHLRRDALHQNRCAATEILSLSAEGTNGQSSCQ